MTEKEIREEYKDPTFDLVSRTRKRRLGWAAEEEDDVHEGYNTIWVDRVVSKIARDSAGRNRLANRMADAD